MISLPLTCTKSHPVKQPSPEVTVDVFGENRKTSFRVDVLAPKAVLAAARRTLVAKSGLA